VSEVGLSQTVAIGPFPFPPMFFVGRKTHPSNVKFTDNSPYAGRDDRIPARNDSGYDSKLRDVLELIAKGLEILENKIYFPSPEFEHIARFIADKESSSAALADTRAATSADTASKAAIAAAAECQSAFAATMRLTAIQKENDSKTVASEVPMSQASVRYSKERL